MNWTIGDYCTIKISGLEYLAKIEDWSDISRRENNYDLLKLRLYQKERDAQNEVIVKDWIHPEPVQSYRIRRTGMRPENLPEPKPRPSIANFWQQPPHEQGKTVSQVANYERETRPSRCIIEINGKRI